MSPETATLLAPLAVALGVLLGTASRRLRHRVGRTTSLAADVTLAAALVLATVVAQGREYLLLAALVIGLGASAAVPRPWVRGRDGEQPGRPS